MILPGAPARYPILAAKLPLRPASVRHNCLCPCSGPMGQLHWEQHILLCRLTNSALICGRWVLTTLRQADVMVQLADFGLSRVMETNATHISTNTIGTIAYQPEEVG